MGTRHRGRELALKALYRFDVEGSLCADDLAQFFASFPEESRAQEFAARLVNGVRAETASLDELVAGVLEHWSLRRLSLVDHNILRLAVYELMRMEDIPARVTIDEAIELAKSYGDRESGRFVNGVLDRIAERLGLKHKGDETGVVDSR